MTRRSHHSLTMRSSRIAAVAALVVITGCRTGSEEQRDTADGQVSRVELPASADTSPKSSPQSTDSLRDDFVEHGLLVSDSRAQVIARLGQPDSTAARGVINRHMPSQTDSIVDLFYPGLQLTYYVVGDGKKEFLQTAMVLDNRYLKYPHLGIGTPEAAILRSLGQPGSREPGKYRYDCARCIGEESPVYFYLDRGRVQRIEYTFYVD